MSIYTPLFKGGENIRYDRQTAKERWTISKMEEYGDFCGWDTLKELINSVEIGMKGPAEEILIHDEKEQEETRAIIATTFETGARIGEILGQEKEDGVSGIRLKDIQLRADKVEVRIEVEKRYDKVGKITRYKCTNPDVDRIWNSKEEAEESELPYEKYEGFSTRRKKKKGETVRNISIPVQEPLIDRVLDWWNKVKKESETEEKNLFSMKYNRFYRTIRKAGEKIGEDFPPHRLRAERATQLLLEYGLDAEELTDWMKWKSPEMAQDYTTLKSKVVDSMMEGAKRRFGK